MDSSPEVLPAAHHTFLLPKRTRRWSVSRHLWASLDPHDVEERRVLEEALSKVRVRATVAPGGAVMADFGLTDFGQTDFGQFSDRLWPAVGLTDFGQTDFGQFWPEFVF